MSVQYDHGSYRIYGLNVSSPWLLPEAIPNTDKAQPDVMVKLEPDLPPPGAFNDDGSAFQLRSSNAACYAHRRLGVFQIRGGNEIKAAPGPEADDAMTRVGLLGPSLAIALIQRTELVLHGSAVAVDGSAVAFVGPRGHGKSTFAAGMVARGHALVSDDVLTVESSSQGDTPRVVPGYPQLKLWPDAAEALGHDPDKLSFLYRGVEKRVLRCFDRFAHSAKPLGHIYLLLGGPKLDCELVSPSEAFRILSGMWFGARFGRRALGLIDQKLHFEAISSLARSVPPFDPEKTAGLGKPPRSGIPRGGRRRPGRRLTRRVAQPQGV